jgi:hypothetical protein
MNGMKLRSNDLDWKQIDDEIIALDTGRAEYLGVDGAGVALWRALDEGADRDELAASLTQRYGIPPARAMADVEAFLSDLAARNLLV